MSELLECLFSCDLKKLRSYFEDVDVNCVIPGTDGCTPLHVVAGIENFKNNENIISFLLDNGANPNARSYENLTPVHIAAMWDNCFQLEKLLQKGGNPWLTDNDNKNSFDMAADNHAYEAFQLLNIYLAESRFTFKSDRRLSPDNLIGDFTIVEMNENAESSVSSMFFSANECFPLMLSSFADNNSLLLNVSNCIKKKILKQNTSKDSKNIFCSDLMNQSTKSYMKENLQLTVRNSSFENHYKSSLNHANISVTDLENSTATMPSNSNSLVEHSIIFTGDPDIMALSEVKNLPGSVYSSSPSISSSATDWKSYRIENSSDDSSASFCSSHSRRSIVVPDALQKCSNSEIYEKLVQLGDNPGPVLEHTRQVYLKRLARLTAGCSKLCDLPAPKFCQEVYRFFDMPLDKGKRLEEIMEAEFDSDTSQNWREGNQRHSFNYFLLDPRISQNLPLRASNLGSLEAFLMFLDALFYVGKGTKGRPYDHLVEAAKVLVTGTAKSEKTAHILDIWRSGFGVISLHCFHNAKAVEAYTREACIIEAVGLNNLTNVKKGNYYGSSSRLTVYKKRLVGISLLYRAYKIFLVTGEKQIKPNQT